jgi:hypothetical protein
LTALCSLVAPLQSLPGLLRQKTYRKRTAGRLRWHFPGGGFQIAVGLYALLQPAVKSSPHFLNTNNYQPLQVESALVCQDTGAPYTGALLMYTIPCRDTLQVLIFKPLPWSRAVGKARHHAPAVRRQHAVHMIDLVLSPGAGAGFSM